MPLSSSSASYILKRTEFLVVAAEESLLAVVKEAAEFFSFNVEQIQDVSALVFQSEARTSPLVVLVSLLNLAEMEEKTRLVSQVRSTYPRAQVLAVLEGSESLDEGGQLKAAGAQRFILHSEIQSTSKFFYLCSLLVLGAYIPVQVADFFPGTEVGFNAYHKLPLNQKFIPVVFAGFPFSDKKYRRLEAVKQVYVRREDLNLYSKYIQEYHDRSGTALKKRCRAMMMNLMGAYTELMMKTSLDFQVAKEESLPQALDQFIQMAVELGDHLKDCTDAWTVISQSLDFQLCRYERGPSVLAYALYISVRLGLPSPSKIILTGLLADVGILDLSRRVYQQLQRGGERQLAPAEMELYRMHPQLSLSRALDKEIALDEELQSILVCTHERQDEKGFPHKVAKNQIPFESQLIQFCEKMDQRVRANLQDGILTHDFVRKQVWEEERHSLTCFSEEFLDKIEKVVISAVA